MSQDTTLRAEINRRLLESGELERLESLFLDLLRESGWYENTKNTCAEKLRSSGEFAGGGGGVGSSSGGFNRLTEEVERECREKVPEVVRVEMVTAIKKVLEGMVEG
ncbi:hypothetical protein L873DRAFT_1828627 [Choiromyces venosus 120613-1]|uniref:Transcription and mRNA export factor SUS1 n=1 Tax=Choiromyces venosus 120613-1 TaxID=1336337 RepID=A0A3N4JIM9_9PEZI|nr:hypothetical protein L873DRAFT_1828627 [Choiromyces venosus 120613-1]